jgi:hypothetical protein
VLILEEDLVLILVTNIYLAINLLFQKLFENMGMLDLD